GCSPSSPRARSSCPATATTPPSATSVRTCRSGSIGAGDRMTALPYDQRPTDDTPVHTIDLPATPQRDRNIPATAWVEAPPELLHVGDDIGKPQIDYKRRI